MPRTLQAPVTVSFDYTRSTGPVLGRFLTGLRDGALVGGRTSDGRVMVPPPEFDPVTHEPVTDFVEVAGTGTVTTWSWVPEPVAEQPFDRPFAFALITLDGADTPRPGVEWAGYDREFEEADVAEQRDVEPRGRIWILPATDGASVGLKLPGHRRYDDAVAQFADVDAARAAVAAIDELLGVGPRG